MCESNVLLTDGQVFIYFFFFSRVLQISPIFDERLAGYKQNILERAAKSVY